MLARFPYGVFALAAILYLAQARGSYAVAGLVDGAFGLGAAAGAPWQSRLIDRQGQRRVLVIAAVVDVTATGLLIALTEAGAATVALVACGLVGGVAVPNVGGALRAMWSSLLRGREQLLPTAFAIDSVALEVLFTAGPLLAAGIIAVASPLAALVVSAGCSLIGTLAFVAQRPSQAWRPDPDAGARGRLGALSSSGVRTLAFAAPRSGSASAPSRSRCRVSPNRTASASWQACCSRPGRSAACWAGLSTARSPGAGRSLRCTSGCQRCSHSASFQPCSLPRSPRWRS
jgi:MFS family permease